MKQYSNRVNYFFNTAYQVFTVLAPLITVPYISRVLGPEGIGQCSYTYSIVSYFVLLATLGSTTFGQREIAYNNNDIKKRSIVFWNVFSLRLLTSLIALFLYVLFVTCIYNGANKTLLYIQAIYIINVAIDTTWFFQGMSYFVALTIRNSFIRLFSIVLIFLFINDTGDTYIYAFILALSATLSFFVTLPLLKREVTKFNISSIDLKNQFSQCLIFFVPTIAVQLYTVLDKTMIGVFSVSNVENGYYEQSEKIVKMTIILITSLSTVLAPKIANAYQNKDSKLILTYMRQLINYVFFTGMPIVVGLICISDFFVPFFLGSGFEKCTLLMKLFAPIVLFIGLSNALGTTYLVQTGRQKTVNYSVILGAVINVGLNFFLIPKYLSIGAAIASVCAEGSVCLYQIISMRKSLDYFELFRGIFKYVLTSILMGCIVFHLGYYMSSYGLSNSIVLVTQVLCGGIIYFVLLLLLRDSFLSYFIKIKK